MFIFGCVGSSFLCEGFLQLRRVGATLHRGPAMYFNYNIVLFLKDPKVYYFCPWAYKLFLIDLDYLQNSTAFLAVSNVLIADIYMVFLWSLQFVLQMTARSDF